MGVQLTATATMDRTVHRFTKNGGVADVEVKPDEYVIPRDGEHRLRISGYSDPFEMTGQYGTQQKIRIEFQLVQGKMKGERFASLFGLTVGPKSKLGPVLGDARNKAIAIGESIELDDFAGLELYATTKATLAAASGNTYVDIAASRPVTPEDDEDAPQAKKAASDVEWPGDE